MSQAPFYPPNQIISNSVVAFTKGAILASGVYNDATTGNYSVWIVIAELPPVTGTNGQATRGQAAFNIFIPQP